MGRKFTGGARKRISYLVGAVCALLICVSFFAGSAHAQAETTLTYTGNNFTAFQISNVASGGTPPVPYTTSDRVSIVIKLSSPLPPNMPLSDVSPIEATATDGINEITLTDAFFRVFRFATDSAGDISAWGVAMSTRPPGPGKLSSIRSFNSSDLGVSDSASDQLCGPDSAPGACSFTGLPSYAQEAANSNAPGTWSIGLPDTVPTADAGADQSVRNLGATVTLDGSASFDDNTASGDLLYAWQLTGKPGGSAAALAGANTATPSFVADVSGTYTASLVVTDSIGQSSAADEVIVSTANLAPTADAGPDLVVPVGDIVVLDGSGSSDPEGMALSYAWTLGPVPAGSTAVLANANSSGPNLIPDKPGIYGVTLVVSDDLGPGAPDGAEITAVARGDFASMKIAYAADLIAGLPESAVKTKGNQKALLNHLAAAAKAVQRPDFDKAVEWIELALQRTDGCAMNGVPDGNGVGRDWIETCDAQLEIDRSLNEALGALR